MHPNREPGSVARATDHDGRTRRVRRSRERPAQADERRVQSGMLRARTCAETDFAAVHLEARNVLERAVSGNYGREPVRTPPRVAGIERDLEPELFIAYAARDLPGIGQKAPLEVPAIEPDVSQPMLRIPLRVPRLRMLPLVRLGGLGGLAGRRQPRGADEHGRCEAGPGDDQSPRHRARRPDELARALGEHRADGTAQYVREQIARGGVATGNAHPLRHLDHQREQGAGKDGGTHAAEGRAGQGAERHERENVGDPVRHGRRRPDPRPPPGNGTIGARTERHQQEKRRPRKRPGGCPPGRSARCLPVHERRATTSGSNPSRSARESAP